MVTSSSKKAASKKQVKVLTPEQKHAQDKRSFARSVRTILERIGFQRVSELSDVEIEFSGRKGDFDDSYVYENVIVLIEYTVSNPTQVGDHVKGKAHLFSKIDADTLGFIMYLMGKFPGLKSALSKYHPSQIWLKILYCSKSEIKEEHQALAPSASFWWHSSIRYFSDLSSAIKRSARYEVFDFLKIPHEDVGSNGAIAEGQGAVSFHGSVLPEPHSNFPSGFKVISFGDYPLDPPSSRV